ncbi:MAG TPA: nitroreductase family deazaflavin-dependent oxidoreductase [Thermomicrobiales bacterium]|nr:nitroreductase family deazaflavin-dependent oxidoreductase [Thermomicrobiales bacterium]
MSTYGPIENHVATPAGAARHGVAPKADQVPPRPASTFHPSRAFRFANRFMTTLLRAGLPISSNYLLTVPGRKSGLLRTTPVTIVEYDGERWLTSPFGEVDWVRNLRAAGEGTLHRGHRSEVLLAQEVSPAEAAPVLKWMLTEIRIPSAVRNQYLVPPDAPDASYEQEARYHPVFRLSEKPVA